MTVPVELERYIGVSIEEALRADAGVVAAGLPIQFGGGRYSAPQSAEEWLEVWMVALPRDGAARARYWASGRVTWQVTCFSRTSNARVDRDGMRPWSIAGTVRAAMEGVRIAIRPYGNAAVGASTPVLGHIRPREAQAVYLPEPSIRPREAQGVRDEPSNLHAVAVTFMGTVVVS